MGLGRWRTAQVPTVEYARYIDRFASMAATTGTPRPTLERHREQWTARRGGERQRRHVSRPASAGSPGEHHREHGLVVGLTVRVGGRPPRARLGRSVSWPRRTLCRRGRDCAARPTGCDPRGRLAHRISEWSGASRGAPAHCVPCHQSGGECHHVRSCRSLTRIRRQSDRWSRRPRKRCPAGGPGVRRSPEHKYRGCGHAWCLP